MVTWGSNLVGQCPSSLAQAQADRKFILDETSGTPRCYSLLFPTSNGEYASTQTLNPTDMDKVSLLLSIKQKSMQKRCRFPMCAKIKKSSRSASLNVNAPLESLTELLHFVGGSIRCCYRIEANGMDGYLITEHNTQKARTVGSYQEAGFVSRYAKVRVRSQ